MTLAYSPRKVIARTSRLIKSNKKHIADVINYIIIRLYNYIILIAIGTAYNFW